ncbi:MAG: multidrug efflux RND transporter permease subunit [Syntrophobacteraceae bacterium]|nr:multidrug efflux RND transporter permease subunit [Syntrophobacteraceae bacterium]
MNLSEIFIKRPVASTLLTVGMTLAGVVAFYLLPVAPLPQIDFPTISVQAGLPGADPETMATSVAAPLERQLGHIAGVTEMTSTSTLGGTSIVLQFELDRNIDGAARDVQAAINAARSNLPSNLPSNPTYRKVNPADAPILIIALTSSLVSKSQMYDTASTVLAQKLAQVRGVGQVFAGGGALPAVRVELSPGAVSKYGLGLNDVASAIQLQSVFQPEGQFENGSQIVQIVADDQLHTAAQYRRVIIKYQNGAPVRLCDLGSVEDSVQDLRTGGGVNGKPAIMLIVFRSPGANIINTVGRVRALLPQLSALVPKSVELSVVLDRSPPIKGSLQHVEHTLVISGILVVLVVFAFLRNVRGTIIPAVAVPVSLISSFGVMYLFGYSLDNLSLMALTIATGFVVDDAIVVLENITRYIEQGLSPMEAALVGAREIAFTVLSMSVSLVAVFIPILLMGGMVGRLFREFAVTLSAAIVISLVISLTTTPMMCAAILRKEKPGGHGYLYRASEWVYERLRMGYEVSLGWAIRHSFIMLFITVLTLAVNVVLFSHIPKGFFPDQDTGRIAGRMQASQDISFQSMNKKLTKVMNIIRKDPDVTYVTGFTGGGGIGASTTNSARMFISLKPFAERKATAMEIIGRLRKKLATVAGAPTFLQPVQDLRVGGHISNAEYQYTLRDENLAELNNWAPRIMAMAAKLPELRDVSSDQQNMGRQTYLAIDRTTASRLGISTRLIDNTLYSAFGQSEVGINYTPLNQYYVVMELAPPFLERPETLKDVYVHSSTGAEVPLSAFARYIPRATSLEVDHASQFPSVTISFNLAPGVALGDAVNAIQAATDKMRIPETVHGSFLGTAQAFQASLANEPILILAALVSVYIVLGILYESYVHPITILSTLPSAGVGALVALLICREDLSLIAVVGIILLIGLVKKNGIMIVDFALESERKYGKSPSEAIYEASLLRFRPIMMTTMAALLGALPLALGSGVGYELRRPLGISIVGGLIFSQMLTLFTTPVIYLYMDRLRIWLQSLRGKGLEDENQ